MCCAIIYVSCKRQRDKGRKLRIFLLFLLLSSEHAYHIHLIQPIVHIICTTILPVLIEHKILKFSSEVYRLNFISPVTW